MQIENFLKLMGQASTQGVERTTTIFVDAGGFKAAYQEALSGSAKRDERPATVTGIRVDNPLAADMWPDRFSARMTHAAEKLGLSVDEVKERFAVITTRAMEEGGYIDPKSFLASLQPEEREILQHVQGLAERIDDGDINRLDPEGALNLLLPPGAQRDFNNDGFRGVGEALTFQIPPDSAPQEVKDAWAELMDDMSPTDRLMAEGRFLPLFISANIKVGASGEPVGIYGPRDPGYRNPFEVSGFSYRGLAEDKLAFIESYRGKIGEAQYREEKAFWTRYLQKLDKFGVEVAQKDNQATV